MYIICGRILLASRLLERQLLSAKLHVQCPCTICKTAVHDIWKWGRVASTRTKGLDFIVVWKRRGLVIAVEEPRARTVHKDMVWAQFQRPQRSIKTGLGAADYSVLEVTHPRRTMFWILQKM